MCLRNAVAVGARIANSREMFRRRPIGSYAPVVGLLVLLTVAPGDPGPRVFILAQAPGRARR